MHAPAHEADGRSASSSIRGRKADHLDLCAGDQVDYRVTTTLLECVKLLHQSLPELSFDELSTEVDLLGRRLRAPFVIAAMTGGHERAAGINRSLATVAQERGLAFGLGSQRAMQRDPALRWTYRVREWAPDALLLGNIGLATAGVRYVDTSGAGGTSWVGVETLRASGVRRSIGEGLWDWGIPTAASVHYGARAALTTIATGGIRSGLDVACAVALGAQAAGIARPLLQALVHDGEEGLRDYLDHVENELRTVMLLTGSRNLEELRHADRIIVGELEKWLAFPDHAR
jgi:isopentenyl diphosphate isomerase/L-lactate dehydrogenase-like FMN-dependent dehydrogenase